MKWYMTVKSLDTATVDLEYFFETHYEYISKKNDSEKFSFAVKEYLCSAKPQMKAGIVDLTLWIGQIILSRQIL